MKNKRILVAFILIVMITITGCKKSSNENNGNYTINPNTNQGVVEDKELDVFTFTNTSLIWNGNSTDLETLITNKSDNDTYLKGFNIYVTDENGDKIATLYGYVGSTIPAHTSRIMSTGHYMDLSKAAKVEYEIIR